MLSDTHCLLDEIAFGILIRSFAIARVLGCGLCRLYQRFFNNYRHACCSTQASPFLLMLNQEFNTWCNISRGNSNNRSCQPYHNQRENLAPLWNVNGCVFNHFKSK
ncbi:hypothetical protein M758_6G006500 [Ceratodon purpureus]|nr:hypothetical protein M758_6G006500 [Ceratodon purpureus]